MTDDDSGQEMPAEDRRLLDELGTALGRDPLPDRLVESCEGLVTWMDVDHELAALLDEDAVEVIGTRGPAGASAGTLTFEVGDGGTVIEVIVERDELRGQVLPAGATEAVLEARSGPETVSERRAPVDDLGRFAFGGVATGPVRLRLEGGASRSLATDWFVV